MYAAQGVDVMDYDLLSAVFGIVSAFCAGIAARAWFIAGKAPAPWVEKPGYDDPDALKAFLADYDAIGRYGAWNRIGAVWAAGAAFFGGLASILQALPHLLKVFSVS